MKRSNDDSYEYNKRSRSDNDFPDLRLLIASKSAGAVIGKGGELIKRLRSDYNAEVNLPDSNTPERILRVSADAEKILDIVREIIPRIDDQAQRRSGDSEIRVLIHQGQAGALIGKGGSKIKELRETTRAGIKCLQECAPRSNDRVVIVTGKQEDVMMALREVMAICAEVAIKGNSRTYDAANYDADFYEAYGGYPPDKSFRGDFSANHQRGSTAARYGLSRRGGYSRERNEPRFSRYNAPTTGRYDDYRPPRRSSSYEDDGGRIITNQVTIPNDLAGVIIGKGGDRINRIRDESRAKITVNESEPGSHERVITIVGTREHIKTAQHLLQQCVKASPAGKKYIQNSYY